MPPIVVKLGSSIVADLSGAVRADVLAGSSGSEAGAGGEILLREGIQESKNSGIHFLNSLNSWILSYFVSNHFTLVGSECSHCIVSVTPEAIKAQALFWALRSA